MVKISVKVLYPLIKKALLHFKFILLFSVSFCNTCPLNAVCVGGECACIAGFYFIDNTCQKIGESMHVFCNYLNLFSHFVIYLSFICLFIHFFIFLL